MPAHVRETECTIRYPRAVSAITSSIWLRASRAHGTATSTSSHDDGEVDHLVKDAANLVAAAHVVDQHTIGADHTGPYGA